MNFIYINLMQESTPDDLFWHDIYHKEVDQRKQTIKRLFKTVGDV